jgi:UDP-N-acetylglucosamine--N-acetylmuramyl-(pentapeptide) pyrophosphoryl-undecaprenol N-acetylglucosamine transferase
MPGYFSKADVVIGRSGANTVAEVIASRRRAIFVPIPWAQSDEQTINAQLATKEGLAKIITQAELTSGVLLSLIKEILAEEKKFNKKSAIRDLDMHAAVNLAKIITELAK